MKASDDELRRLFKQATARPEGRADRCPSAETLRSAADGLIPADERDGLVEHLASCSNCAAEHRVLADVRDWAQEAGRTGEARTGATTAGAKAPMVPRRRTARFGVASWPQGIAAALAAISLTLAGWTVWLHRQNRQLSASVQAGEVARAADAIRAQKAEAELERLRSAPADAQPLLNVAIVDLFARGAERGGPGPSIVAIDAPPGTGLVTFILNPQRRPAPGEYRLTLLDAHGAVLWQGEGLRPAAEKNFTFAVPSPLLTTGEYRIRVAGGRDDRSSAGGGEEYVLRVR